MKEEASFIDELKKRSPRLAANITLAIGIYIITTFLVSPLFSTIDTVLPIVNVPISELTKLVLYAVVALFGVRIVIDLMRLIDVGSSSLISRLPGMTSEDEVSIRRALKDVVYIIVVILVVWPVLPILSRALSGVPLLGGYIGSAASYIVLGVILFFLYDISRIIYRITSAQAVDLVDLIAKKLRRKKAPVGGGTLVKGEEEEES